MATSITKTYTRTIGAYKSTDTTIRKLLPVKLPCADCGDEVSICPTCNNDQPFYQYVSCTDKIHLQFFLPDLYNENPVIPESGWKDGWLDVTIVTPSGEIELYEMSEAFQQWMVGSYNQVPFQNLIADMVKICELLNGERCFYFKIANCKPTVPSYIISENCVEDFPSPIYNGEVGDYWLCPSCEPPSLFQWNDTAWESVELVNGQIIFCKKSGVFYEVTVEGESITVTIIDNPNLDPNYEIKECTYCYSNLFRVELCEDLIEFAADFSNGDCSNNVYNLADNYVGSSNFLYNPTMKVKGTIETVAFPMEQETTEKGTVVSVKKKELALVRMWGMPENIVRRLTNYFTAREWYINNEVWDTHTDIAKNNDQGHHWWLEFNVERENCIKRTFECDE